MASLRCFRAGEGVILVVAAANDMMDLLNMQLCEEILSFIQESVIWIFQNGLVEISCALYKTRQAILKEHFRFSLYGLHDSE
jgi:hypothetical protein